MWLLLFLQSFGFNTAANMNDGGVSLTTKVIATNILAFDEIGPAESLGKPSIKKKGNFVNKIP